MRLFQGRINFRPLRRCFSSAFDPRVGLSSEEQEVFDLALDFSRREMLPKAEEWDAKEHFPRDVLRSLGGLGFGGIYCGTDYGGTGLSRVAAAGIFEALSTACVSTTAYLSIHNMCAWMIDTYGTVEQRAKWLPKLCSAEKLASYCLTEPGAGSDAASLRTSAVRKGDYYILNGEKAFISGGGETDFYVVMCRTGAAGAKGISTVVVERDAPGLSFGKKECKLGWNSQPTRAVIFQDCRVPVANLLGQEGQGFKIALSGLDGGRVNIAACSVGGAQACIDYALGHVKQRSQFGATLSTFQNIQFKLADFAAGIVSSRDIVRKAASKIDQNDPAKSVHCAMAKKIATETCFDVANGTLQMLGGYGYLKDYPIQRYMRDLRVHMILEGTNEIMRLIVARDLLKD